MASAAVSLPSAAVILASAASILGSAMIILPVIAAIAVSEVVSLP